MFSLYVLRFLSFCLNCGEDFINAIYTQSVTIFAHKMKPDCFLIRMIRMPE